MLAILIPSIYFTDLIWDSISRRFKITYVALIIFWLDTLSWKMRGNKVNVVLSTKMKENTRQGREGLRGEITTSRKRQLTISQE